MKLHEYFKVGKSVLHMVVLKESFEGGERYSERARPWNRLNDSTKEKWITHHGNQGLHIDQFWLQKAL